MKNKISLELNRHLQPTFFLLLAIMHVTVARTQVQSRLRGNANSQIFVFLNQSDHFRAAVQILTASSPIVNAVAKVVMQPKVAAGFQKQLQNFRLATLSSSQNGSSPVRAPTTILMLS